MERWARARFKVIRVNRWSLALSLLAVLASLLLPARTPVQVSRGAPGRVRQGVMLLNRDFSAKTEHEARAMLSEMAGEVQAAAVSAREFSFKDGLPYVIPELNGYTMDIETTWFRLSMASEGSRVEPATRIQQPEKRLVDFPESVIRQGNTGKRAVSLLINVDWGTRELTEMLPVLKKRGVRTTFFVSGRWADQNKQLLRLMAGDGHEIASHGYDLRYGPIELARSGKLKADIARSVASIEAITGRPVRYYAPHKSEISREILKTVAALKLRTVLYSLDTTDWRDSTTAERILTVIGQAKPGDLVLMHPKPNTAKALDRALQHLQSSGLQSMTLTEVISPDPGATPGATSRGHE